ncbi:MAG: hypothetical protein MJD61_11675 [Proteobacteria bacterium]|nr:hypothetical protein [Pseudomonadota bacterium]
MPKAAEEPARLADPPQGRARRLTDVLIAGFVLVQLALPLSCYLADRGSDERFCWRMFSTLRMRSCSVLVLETRSESGERVSRELALYKALHSAWVSSLKRFRRNVVDKFLRWRCEQPGTTSAVFTRSCREPDGSEVPADRLAIDCTEGWIRVMGSGR